MKASILILAGLGAGLTLGMSGCVAYHRYPIAYEDPRSPAERAQACVSTFEPDGKAAQVMTYDSATGTETHMNSDGRQVAVTAQNARDNTALGMGGKVGGGIPVACTDADPRVLPAYPAPPAHHKDGYNGYH
ncbi:hypothetical protein [Asticcacaulis sp. EMRT-3]|uniref:hypothetical protein n=1 Tax=Asticcacaulis sp. EMRT-3 TaxID=3040349 RepID=UPI0024AF5F24|nr:hypothetical protein [Asticcacaulis sp. EMRT-3]MDI7776309.1 hypothetical protein [Asticcacaulis sp. EMRT-3]